jgi:hypothetical protein
MCYLGCSQAPPCKVSPVELEELREDISVLKRDLKNAQDREAQLTADLKTKQATLADRRTKPDSLRAQLEAVKKGAGKTEKAKEAPAKPAVKPAPATTTPAPAAKQPAATTPPAATPPAAKTPPPATKGSKAPSTAPKDSTKTPPAAPKKGTP